MGETDRYLPPWALQLIGVILLIAFGVFWALTGRESLLLITTAVSLILLNGYKTAGRALLEKLSDRERDT